MCTTPSPLKSPYSALNGPLITLTSCTSSGLSVFSDPRYPCPCPCVVWFCWTLSTSTFSPPFTPPWSRLNPKRLTAIDFPPPSCCPASMPAASV